MRSDYTDITFLLDRSGSMERIKSDTEGGFKSFVDEQKTLPGTCLVTLDQFDNVWENVYTGLPVQEIPNLALRPRNGTALLDAMARSIHATGERLANMVPSDRPGVVLFVTMTDGQENSSVEYRREQVMDLVCHQSKTYNWRFIYLGANQDAIASARGLGIDAGSSLSYAHNAAGTSRAYRSLSRSVSGMRAASQRGSAMDSSVFNDEDRAAQKEAGAPPDSSEPKGKSPKH